MKLDSTSFCFSHEANKKKYNEFFVCPALNHQHEKKNELVLKQ